jgi:hypothetical protein
MSTQIGGEVKLISFTGQWACWRCGQSFSGGSNVVNVERDGHWLLAAFVCDECVKPNNFAPHDLTWYAAAIAAFNKRSWLGKLMAWRFITRAFLRVKPRSSLGAN